MMERKAKIVATIGPASHSREVLTALVEAGMNVARLNFSHGTHDVHADCIRSLREVIAETGVAVGILQDLQGPKIRVGVLEPPLDLEPGARVTLFAEDSPPPDNGTQCVPVAFVELFDSVAPRDRILLDDGRLALQVSETHERYLIAEVRVGGRLTSHKGINLPGARLSIPGFTEKDRADLIFGLEQEVDFVAVSFVRTAQDILTVRKAIEELDEGGTRPLLIAKLEKPEALDNLEEILQVTDGVMVARGDLGVEMSPECVPMAQKHIIQQANLHGKLVITATQMLESMMSNPLPTRAEASDVANAIFDGTDAVMLSGETAAGQYPLEAVKMMDRIVRQAETNFADWGHFKTPSSATHDDAASTTRAARELAHDLNVAAVAVYTQTGRTALMMSKARPRVPILAFTPARYSFGRMSLYWGVSPHLVPMVGSLREMVNLADSKLMDSQWAKPGQQVVVVSGFPVNTMRPPNMAYLHNVGEKI